jgi:hypothetical protein
MPLPASKNVFLETSDAITRPYKCHNFQRQVVASPAPENDA